MPLSLEQLQCVLIKPSMPSAKVISLRKRSHKSLLHSVPTASVHTLLAMTTALYGNAICKGCSKKGHCRAKCCSSGTAGQQLTKSNGAEKAPCHQCCGKGKKADMVQVNTEEAFPCDELFVNMVNCGTVGDTHPEEIVVDDIHIPWCNEAYTMVQLPASASSKGTASLCIKVNTGAGGNVLLLHSFQCLYPNWISPDGLSTGLDHVSTRLTAYNGSHIPLYGALHGHIIWWPGGPGA